MDCVKWLVIGDAEQCTTDISADRLPSRRHEGGGGRLKADCGANFPNPDFGRSHVACKQLMKNEAGVCQREDPVVMHLLLTQYYSSRAVVADAAAIEPRQPKRGRPVIKHDTVHFCRCSKGKMCVSPGGCAQDRLLACGLIGSTMARGVSPQRHEAAERAVRIY